MPLSFWVILLAVLVYGMLHSLLASLWAKARARRWFGLHTDRWFRLIYNLVAAVTLLPVFLLPILMIDRVLYRVPFPWYLLNFAGQILAVIALVVGIWQTGMLSFLGLLQLFRGSSPARPRLVIDGLYRWVRHPLYTAGLLLIWLAPTMSCNLLALNIGMTVYILIGAVLEERKLLKEFGIVYEVYYKQTPMLIPFLRWPGSQQ